MPKNLNLHHEHKVVRPTESTPSSLPANADPLVGLSDYYFSHHGVRRSRALLSQLGSKTQPVAWLYFSDQPQKELLHKLQATLDAIEQAGGEDTTEYRQAINEYEQATRPITKPFDQIIGGQVWRLVTPAFLHFGAVHLIFNMMWLWTLGSMLETYLRKVKFVLLFVAIAVISNIA